MHRWRQNICCSPDNTLHWKQHRPNFGVHSASAEPYRFSLQVIRHLSQISGQQFDLKPNVEYINSDASISRIYKVISKLLAHIQGLHMLVWFRCQFMLLISIVFDNTLLSEKLIVADYIPFNGVVMLTSRYDFNTYSICCEVVLCDTLSTRYV